LLLAYSQYTPYLLFRDIGAPSGVSYREALASEVLYLASPADGARVRAILASVEGANFNAIRLEGEDETLESHTVGTLLP